MTTPNREAKRVVALADRVEQILSCRGDGTGTFNMIAAPTNITAITTATPGVVTAASHGLTNGDYVYIQGVVGATTVNDKIFIVAAKETNTFELTDTDGADFAVAGTWSSGGTVQRAFICRPPAGKQYMLTRLNMNACDGKLTLGKYMDVALSSGNGIIVDTRNAAGLIKRLTSTPVKCWTQWALMTGGPDTTMETTSSSATAGIRWTWEKSSSKLVLNGDAGEYLAFIQRDDMSGLVSHQAAVQGYQETAGSPL